MRALVVVNPVSGPARARPLDACRALACEILGRHQIAADVAVTRARGDARRLAEEARRDGVDLVLAWGGDGTIHEVAGAIAFSDVRLGIVPGGSGNGLARDLGIPLDSPRALEVAATGRVRVIDAGEIGGALFFNVAGIGLDADIARKIASPTASRGLSGYARVTLRELPRYRACRYTIGTEGRSIEERALFIALANSRQYGSGAQIAPDARLDDGRLHLVVVEDQPLWRLLARIPAFFRGTLADGRGVRMLSVTEATIRGEGRLAFHADGEPYEGAEVLHVRTHAAALRVMVR